MRDTPPIAESFWPAETTAELIEATVGDLLRQAVAEVPDRLALVEAVPDRKSRRRWTYEQLLSEAERVAHALLDRFEPGERIAVWAPNIPEWVLLQLGAAASGMVLVTINPAYRAQELDYVLRQSRAVGLFHAEESRGNPMAATVSQLRSQLPDLREAVNFNAWEGFSRSGDDTTQLPDVTAGQPAQILYTSGTTGFPKGALLSHRSIVNWVRFSGQRTGHLQGSSWVNFVPLFHVAGCCLGVLGSLLGHGTHVLVPAFDPSLVLDVIESEKGNVMFAVPTMLIALLDHPDRRGRDLSSLRTVLSGGAVVSPDLVRRTQSELGCGFSIVFGQTETGIVTQTYPDDSPEDQATTIGSPLPQAEVKIADPDSGGILPVGGQGEICVRGYQTMLGYFEMPEASAATLDDDGWLHTGDLGMMDRRGYVRITGRLTDMIIRGGENIYPREIEDVLFAHPGVADVAVLGVPDDVWGEQVAAVVRRRHQRIRRQPASCMRTVALIWLPSRRRGCGA
jgi:fatty-acyl-CoA synthase